MEQAALVFPQPLAGRLALVVSLAALASSLRVPALYAVSAVIAAWTAWTYLRMPPAVRSRLPLDLSRREKIRNSLIGVGSLLVLVATRSSGSPGSVTFYLLVYGVLVTSLLIWRRARLDVGLWWTARRSQSHSA